MKIKGIIIVIALVGHSLTAQKKENVSQALELLSEYPNVRDFALSTTANEIYTSIQSPLGELSVLVQIKKVNNSWEEPKLLPFSGRFMDLEPFLSYDNLRLYFVSNRPLSASVNESKDFDIWYVERKDVSSNWGKPINMGAPINSKYDEFYPSLAKNGNLYFTCECPTAKGKDDIFFSELKDGKYTAPVALSDAVNTESYEFNAFIAPDESYLIFSGYNRKDGLGSGDMYISYREGSKQWATAVNMGETINSKSMDYCPFVDVNSNTLYFTSKRSALEEQHNFKTIDEVKTSVNSYSNGMSRIYKVVLQKQQ